MKRRQLLRIAFLATIASGVLASAMVSSASGQPASPAPASDSTAELIAGLRVQGGLTADAAAARAGKVSPRAAEGRATSEAADAQAGLARLGWLPRVRAQAQYARLSKVDTPDLGPGLEINSLRNQWSNSASIEVPLSDYLLRTPHQVAAARHGAESVHHSERATRRLVEADARIAYYEWVRARLQVHTAERGLALVDESLATTATQVEAGTASRADLLRLESRRAAAELTLRQASDAADRNEDRLRTLIGAGDDERLGVGEDLARVSADALAQVRATKASALWRSAAARRPEILAFRSAEKSALAEARAARADLFPRLSAFGEVAYDNPSARVFPQEDEFTSTWTAGLQITWDFNLALGSPKNGDEARARARAQRARAAQQTELIRDEVLTSRQAVDQAEVAIQVGERGLAAAEESYRVRRALQGAGRATAVEVIDAETDLT
ncbi:MAG TPA: TolC family protein, partial [Kofleriaceae bacterium]|nr:TolC family protein [Kofleriaceae bacterium]